MSVQESLQKKQTEKKNPNSSYFFSPVLIKPKRVAPAAPESFVCALSFMETLGQGGAGTCKSTDLLWHKPTAPCQNNEFLSTPQPSRENVILHAIRAWSVCGHWRGEGLSSPFTPPCWDYFFFLPAGPCARLDSPTREETIGKYW